MTAVINKLQRLLGLRIPDQYLRQAAGPQPEKAAGHHHPHGAPFQPHLLERMLLPRRDHPPRRRTASPTWTTWKRSWSATSDRDLKIGSFTACSNVTGIHTPYHQMAEIMHRHGGYCFVDFAAAAPYVAIDMHPADAAAAAGRHLFLAAQVPGRARAHPG